MGPSGRPSHRTEGGPGDRTEGTQGPHAVHPPRRAQGERRKAPLEPYRPELASTRRPMSGRRPPLVDLCGPSSWSRPPPKEYATLSDWSCNGSTGARQPFGKPTTAWEPVRRGIPRAINPLSSPPACTKPDGASRSCNGNKEAFPAVRCDRHPKTPHLYVGGPRQECPKATLRKRIPSGTSRTEPLSSSHTSPKRSAGHAALPRVSLRSASRTQCRKAPAVPQPKNIAAKTASVQHSPCGRRARAPGGAFFPGGAPAGTGRKKPENAPDFAGVRPFAARPRRRTRRGRASVNRAFS